MVVVLFFVLYSTDDDASNNGGQNSEEYGEGAASAGFNYEDNAVTHGDIDGFSSGDCELDNAATKLVDNGGLIINNSSRSDDSMHASANINGDNNWDFDSDSSYVLLSNVTCDSVNFVIDYITNFEEDRFCESQQQLEKNGDDDNNVSTNSNEDPGDYGGPLNYNYVAKNEFHRYPCERIGHVCGHDCYDLPGDKKSDEKMDINVVTMENVFTSLPAKALCMFRSVSKQLDQWITSPSSVGILPLPLNSGPQGVLVKRYGELCFILLVVEDCIQLGDLW